MSQMSPFKPGGNTVLVNATTSAVASTAALGGTAVLAVNASASITAFVAFGSSSVAAVAPTTGSPQTCVPIPPLGQRVFEVVGSQTWASVIASSAGPSSVYLTPGTGGF
jgi:hypothetical protein